MDRRNRLSEPCAFGFEAAGEPTSCVEEQSILRPPARREREVGKQPLDREYATRRLEGADKRRVLLALEALFAVQNREGQARGAPAVPDVDGQLEVDPVVDARAAVGPQ